MTFLLIVDGALPQTPVHSFARPKELNQEKARSADFYFEIKQINLINIILPFKRPDKELLKGRPRIAFKRAVSGLPAKLKNSLRSNRF